MTELLASPLTQRVIDCAIAVHRALGPGLLESVYETCLSEELAHEGIAFARQVGIPMVYRNARLANAYRVDFIVAESLLVELKTMNAAILQHEGLALAVGVRSVPRA